MTVSAEEFLRRLLLQVLPKGFVRIRHFGLLAMHPMPVTFEPNEFTQHARS